MRLFTASRSVQENGGSEKGIYRRAWPVEKSHEKDEDNRNNVQKLQMERGWWSLFLGACPSSSREMSVKMHAPADHQIIIPHHQPHVTSRAPSPPAAPAFSVSLLNPNPFLSDH
jgi:hypothetical protein